MLSMMDPPHIGVLPARRTTLHGHSPLLDTDPPMILFFRTWSPLRPQSKNYTCILIMQTGYILVYLTCLNYLQDHNYPRIRNLATRSCKLSMFTKSSYETLETIHVYAILLRDVGNYNIFKYEI
jgi:hypothetical protein